MSGISSEIARWIQRFTDAKKDVILHLHQKQVVNRKLSFGYPEMTNYELRVQILEPV